MLEPATSSARVPAMYTHPAYARRDLELMVTVAGEPRYCAYGFKVIERIDAICEGSGGRTPYSFAQTAAKSNGSADRSRKPSGP